MYIRLVLIIIDYGLYTHTIACFVFKNAPDGNRNKLPHSFNSVLSVSFRIVVAQTVLCQLVDGNFPYDYCFHNASHTRVAGVGWFCMAFCMFWVGHVSLNLKISYRRTDGHMDEHGLNGRTRVKV